MWIEAAILDSTGLGETYMIYSPMWHINCQ